MFGEFLRTPKQNFGNGIGNYLPAPDLRANQGELKQLFKNVFK